MKIPKFEFNETWEKAKGSEAHSNEHERLNIEEHDDDDYNCWLHGFSLA